MFKRTRILFVMMLVLWSLCSISVSAQGKKEYCQLNGLEALVPQGFRTNSHMVDGVLQTSFRKDGASVSSLLIVSVTDVGEITLESLDDVLGDYKVMFRNMGLEIGSFTQFSTPKIKGYKAEGKGTYVGYPVTLVVKACIISHYFVQFVEYYGEDLSADYAKIEESIRVSNKPKLTGMQIISDGKCSFTYDADNLLAVKSRADDTTTFTFTSKKSGDYDCFMEINFTENPATDFLTFANNWFLEMQKIMSIYFKDMNLNSMELTNFLGHPGYVRKGRAFISATNTPVALTFKVCRHKGKFVWSVVQQTLTRDMIPSSDTAKLFKDVEESMETIDN